MRYKWQKKLLISLFGAWLLLSVAIGSIVYYLEMNQIDQFVASIAVNESTKFVESSIGSASLVEQSREMLLSRLQETIKHNFIIAELYLPDGTKYLEAIRPGSDAIEADLKLRGHARPTQNSTWHEEHQNQYGLFVMVFTPILNSSGENMGHFEGVYQVDPQTLTTINQRVFVSLLVVVLIILATTIVLYPIMLALNRDILNYANKLASANQQVLVILGSAVAKRDSDTHSHNYRVTIYAIHLAEAIGAPAVQIAELVKGAFLHDVGKIAISDSILLKPGKLTVEEFEIMKTHTMHGIDIIKQSSWLTEAAEVVRFHHEKFDGKGYMAGLQGEAIPLNARIFAVADVFDALTSVRPYKEAFSLAKALEIMQNDRGTHFDPAILDAFLAIAAALYAKCHTATDDVLAEELSKLTQKYFL